MFQRFIAPTILVAHLLALPVAATAAQNTSYVGPIFSFDVPSEWKTVDAVVYPQTWRVLANMSEDFQGVYLLPETGGPSGKFVQVASVVLSYQPLNRHPTTLKEVETFLGGLISGTVPLADKNFYIPSITRSESGSTTFLGHEARWYQIHTLENGTYYGTFTVIDGRLYGMESWPNVELQEFTLDAYDTVANSVRLTKGSSSSSSSSSSARSQASESREDFTDVPKKHAHRAAINYVRDESIVSGYPDGTFKPNAPINRAEFTKIVVGAIIDKPRGSNCFPDVRAEWFASPVCAARELSIVGGYPDGKFRPSDPVTFVEGAKIIAKAFALESQDMPKKPWYAPYVLTLSDATAIPMDIASPDQQLTRGQMAEIIYRLHARKTDLPSKTYKQLMGEAAPGGSPAKGVVAKPAPPIAATPTGTARLTVSDQWEKEWGIMPDEDLEDLLRNVTLQNEGSGAPYLRVVIDRGPNTPAPKKVQIGGVAMTMHPRVAPGKSMYMQYSVRIPENFDYKTGGFLPGIVTGLQNGAPSGSRASAYFLWNEEGYIAINGNFQQKTGGNLLETMTKLPADGKWHTLTLHVQLQTGPGKANGIIEAWLDGDPIATAKNIDFKNRTEDQWDGGLALISYRGIISVHDHSDSGIDLGTVIFSDKKP